MKRKLLWIAAAAMTLSVIGYATYAALNAQMDAQNIIRMGTVKVSLKDEIWKESGEPEDDAPRMLSARAAGDAEEQAGWVDFDASVHALPGSSVLKRLTVTNIGGNACYVRVKMLPQFILEDASAESRGAQIEVADEEHIAIAYNGSEWTLDGEDYYRYHEILQPGESAELEVDIQFQGSIVNDYKNARLTIENLAQGVQSQNNEHADVLDVEGWPAG